MQPRKVVATGVWFYDGTVARRIEVSEYSADFACSRFNDDDQLDETTPIPSSPNGMLYRVGVTKGVDFRSLSEAKAWADVQPWGPVKWDQDSN